jgi:hypothetical protein
MIGMIAGMMGGSRKVGWLVHFMAGTVVYGGAFVVLIILFGTAAYVLIGLLLGALGWGMAMVALMPMAGNGPFGTKLGVMVPVMSLVMHLLFGAVLGWIYGALVVT